MITARALGIYYYLVATKAPITADSLSKVFPEGRKAHLTALKELREVGLIRTSKQVINGRCVTHSYLEVESARIALQLQQNMPNPNNNLLLDINTDLSKPNRSAEVKMSEYGDFPTWLEPEEREEAMRKDRARKHQAKMDFYDKRHKARMQRRDPKNAEGWTTTDSCFEFAEQMHQLWHVLPWKVTRSRFVFALDNKRSEYNTTGDVELKMMKIFFDKIKHDKKINDPEKIWKRFIVEFPMLLLQVQRENATPDQIEEERERSMKSRSKLHVQEQ